MKNFKKELNNVLEMLTSIEDEINLADILLLRKKSFLQLHNSMLKIQYVISQMLLIPLIYQDRLFIKLLKNLKEIICFNLLNRAMTKESFS